MIAIIGAGMSGMFTARALARLGHAVTIFESDAPYAGQDPDTAFQDWQRPGVAQLRQPFGRNAAFTHADLDGVAGDKADQKKGQEGTPEESRNHQAHPRQDEA